MKLVNRNAKANLILSNLVFCVVIVFFYSCGSGGSDSSSETGSVSFGLALQNAGTIRALNNRQLDDSNGQFECQTETYEIAAIEAQVVDENEELLAEGGPFDCEDRQGDIGGIEAGDGRIVKVSAKDSDGDTIFAGESETFAVVAGEVTDAGLITLLPVAEALPPPPAGVAATAGIGQINLNWLPVADAITYNVYFSTSAGVSKANFEDVFRGVGQTSFDHLNLLAGDTFFYVVTAQNDIGESDESAEVSATVLILPEPPEGVIATAGFGQISLSWQPVADATTYNVYFSTSPGVSKSNSEGDFSDVAQTSFIHANLLPGDTFFYVVTAQNDIGESNESAEVSATVPVNTRLIGEFIGTGFGSELVVGEEIIQFVPWTGLFDSDFDGFGGGSFQDIATSDGILEGDDNLSYNIEADGSLTSTLSDGTVFEGILNSDNNILAAVDTDFSDEFIEMDVIIKKSTGLSNAILEGEYIGVRSSSNPSAALTLTNFFGNGNGTFEFLAASDQFLDSGTFTYSVDSDGVVTISGAGAVASEGIVSGDGSVVSLVDTAFRGANEDIDHTVLIKTSSGLSNASLSGDYVAVNTGVVAGSGGETARTSIISDGAGNMSFETLSSSSGTFDTFNATYDVAPNGRLTINLPNQETLEGIVNSKGDIFNFVNTDISDQSIEMGVAIRKTQ